MLKNFLGRGHSLQAPPLLFAPLLQISASATGGKCNGYFQDAVQKLAGLFVRKGRGPRCCMTSGPLKVNAYCGPLLAERRSHAVAADCVASMN